MAAVGGSTESGGANDGYGNQAMSAAAK